MVMPGLSPSEGPDSFTHETPFTPTHSTYSPHHNTSPPIEFGSWNRPKFQKPYLLHRARLCRAGSCYAPPPPALRAGRACAPGTQESSTRRRGRRRAVETAAASLAASTHTTPPCCSTRQLVEIPHSHEVVAQEPRIFLEQPVTYSRLPPRAVEHDLTTGTSPRPYVTPSPVGFFIRPAGGASQTWRWSCAGCACHRKY